MKEVIDFITKYLKEVKPFSGQTFILLSLFSWLMSLLVDSEFVRDFLSWFGWLFLTIGIDWVLAGVKQNILGIDVYPGPWIAGALACSFLFYGWSDVSLAAISWPIVSALIATIPKFLKKGLEVVNPTIDGKKFAVDRQEIVLLLFFSAILSCWIQFFFLLQNWLQEYPSLMADEFTRSAFVVKVASSTQNSRGVMFLNLAETALRERLEPAPWGEVERWLFETDIEIPRLEEEVRRRIPRAEEDRLWNLEGEVSAGNPGYALTLRAFWLGPSSRPDGYYAQKVCSITERPNRVTTTAPGQAPTVIPAATATQVVCEQAVDLNWITPTPVIPPNAE
ncbi:DUF5357 family protein [Oscillatoria sp. FACHB-1407]|uniref:DUF5357 family protein n=1 Tax=Oscillatoria sp. FACHB-1407 TaxID=2692847 RepID=UPI0016896992|nr:DUF5357 family protein [Oscillatoria sp. FACHB-1407]MBD2460023.1 DUF5357 family protein [Oscillatoria sp. FACHB-1407]